MYDTNERVAQVKERAARIKQKKEKRMIRGLSTLCLALCCCLVGILGEVSGGFGSAVAVQGLNGATLLSERTAGGSRIFRDSSCLYPALREAARAQSQAVMQAVAADKAEAMPIRLPRG